MRRKRFALGNVVCVKAYDPPPPEGGDAVIFVPAVIVGVWPNHKVVVRYAGGADQILSVDQVFRLKTPSDVDLELQAKVVAGMIRARTISL